MNDLSSSSSLLDFAELVEETLEDQNSELTEAIAVQHARQGDVERAVEIADSIQDPYSRDQAFGQIAEITVDTQSADYSNELLNSIEDPMMLEMASEQMALRYAYHGRIKEAFEAASKLAVNDALLGNIAVIAANRGLVKEGREVTDSIESVLGRASTLGRLVLNILENSQDDMAQELIDEMKETIDQLEFDDERIDPLVSLATIYQAQGENDLAHEAFENAHRLLTKSASKDPNSRSPKDVALNQIAIGLGRLQAFEEADKVLGEIEDPFEYASTAIALATMYDKHEEQAQIADLLEQAREIGNEEGQYGESSNRQRDYLFIDLARAYASLDSFDQALEVATSIVSPDQKLQALILTGQFAVKAGEERVWNQAAASLDAETSKVGYWLSISDAFLEIKDEERSRMAIERAIKEAQSLPNPYDQCLAFCEIGVRFGKRGQNERAAEILRDSISAIPLIEGGYLKVRALLDLAEKYWTMKRQLMPDECETLTLMVNQLE